MAILSLLLACIGGTAVGQVEIKGTVYDESRLFAMPGVSVLGTSGQGTTTDSVGEYHILLHPGDSIYFSYLGRHTGKIPVNRIVKNYPLDMSLAVKIDSLPLVVVRPKPYRYDSAENRDEYRNVFDYQPENIIFGARKNRQMLALATTPHRRRTGQICQLPLQQTPRQKNYRPPGTRPRHLHETIPAYLRVHHQLRERLRFLQVYQRRRSVFPDPLPIRFALRPAPSALRAFRAPPPNNFLIYSPDFLHCVRLTY